MYQIGDRVVYGMHGVCLVVDLEARVVDRKKVQYLALEPVGQPGSRYLVPTHNAAAMSKLRQLLTAEELKQLLTLDSFSADGWISDENQRKQVYRELLGSGNRERLLRMLRTLYYHKELHLAAGKKVHMCDDNFQRDAERLLCSEISQVLNIEPEQARDYLRGQIKEM